MGKEIRTRTSSVSTSAIHVEAGQARGLVAVVEPLGLRARRELVPVERVEAPGPLNTDWPGATPAYPGPSPVLPQGGFVNEDDGTSVPPTNGPQTTTTGMDTGPDPRIEQLEEDN